MATSLLDIHAFVKHASDVAACKGTSEPHPRPAPGTSERALATLGTQFTVLICYLQWMRSGAVHGQVEGGPEDPPTSPPSKNLQKDASFLDGIAFLRGAQALRWAGKEEILYNFGAVPTPEAVANMPETLEAWQNGTLAFYYGSAAGEARRQHGESHFIYRVNSC